jgi:AcrR family transcriptional regulator
MSNMSVGRPNRREVAAAQTRREILGAARRLFAEQGYANTSMQQIADESGAAIQTVYSSVGSKSALVLALVDLIDDEAGIAELAADLLQETDPHQLIAKSVHLTRQLNERCGDIIRVLLSAEPADTDVVAAATEGLRRHEQGNALIAQRLAELGALQADMTPERAAAVMAMMKSSANWRQLTETAGWTYDESEAWLTASLSQLLLKASHQPAAKPPRSKVRR